MKSKVCLLILARFLSITWKKKCDVTYHKSVLKVESGNHYGVSFTLPNMLQVSFHFPSPLTTSDSWGVILLVTPELAWVLSTARVCVYHKLTNYSSILTKHHLMSWPIRTHYSFILHYRWYYLSVCSSYTPYTSQVEKNSLLSACWFQAWPLFAFTAESCWNTSHSLTPKSVGRGGCRIQLPETSTACLACQPIVVWSNLHRTSVLHNSQQIHKIMT